jgi:cytochrome c
VQRRCLFTEHPKFAGFAKKPIRTIGGLAKCGYDSAADLQGVYMKIQGDSMKALLVMVVAAGSLMLATQASANQALAQKSGCLACHSVDKKVLGPAYKDVAAKYKGDKGAEDRLVAKVKAGGSGVWGPMPMPANSPQVKDEDIRTIVKWILSL